ncbi:DUF1223 domain-containing protein [Chryseobacterium phosphatilyticum]|uniref:DUF1223 domain-containing protein n=1 Tax=Chryseobacterium phosphatilyticum TaxID=475075 RepID=A0A316XEN5_9FLAO|nr:DUF1223 domain-containing protein [Chryseobacterium phosphatilyticum]PWN72014.1 DUF1223 domain-containing protein [Chryseobacterium phosphatilyticum]
MILKNLITVGGFTSLLFAAFAFVHTENSPQKHSDPGTGAHGFAVLELFTSEGCSSCPTADNLMGQIEKEYSNEPVYILSYHVDYWNRLGWKDRFSSAGNSQRQQQYSRILKSQTYTPQLVVNGQTELVGSDRNAIKTAIEKVLFTSKNTDIGLSTKISGHQATIQYSAPSADPNNILLVNLVEKQSSTHVGKGENEGRYLQHWQIVHHQNSISLNTQHKGTTTFKLPDNFSPDQWEIIAFIQNPKTGEIFGSAKTKFN